MEHTLFISKYTPKEVDGFYLPENIRESLNILIETNCLNILLVGGEGSGKTSILHAIVKKYYNIPEEEYRDNILYINNLHEQGINYYRSEVKTFCQTHSNVAEKKKIVMIDDIDIINEQSQQVFRNCIDKYSHNVCFLSTCTNGQKVIESIQSRLTIIRLPPITKQIMISILEEIIQTENIEMDDKARNFIISVSNNTIKNLINYLEKCKLLNKSIAFDTAIKICSDIDIYTLEQYTDYVKQGDINNAIKVLYSIANDGYSVMDILDNYFMFIKNTDKLSENDKYKIVPFICKYITAFHEIHENDIELPLFTNNIVNILK
jgi:DNA polymerase III delta prime subunit